MNTTVVPTSEKPLNQSQLKNLREIVSLDFHDLRNQIAEEVDRRLRDKKDDIRKRYSQGQTSLEDARKTIKDKVRVFEEEIEHYLSELEKDGIVTKNSRHDFMSIVYHLHHLSQEGMTEELQEAEEAASRVKNTAFSIISRENRSIDRTCLLQTITSSGAAEIINDLPQTEDILPLVTQELADKENDALTLLLPDIKDKTKALNGDNQ